MAPPPKSLAGLTRLGCGTVTPVASDLVFALSLRREDRSSDAPTGGLIQRVEGRSGSARCGPRNTHQTPRLFSSKAIVDALASGRKDRIQNRGSRTAIVGSPTRAPEIPHGMRMVSTAGIWVHTHDFVGIEILLFDATAIDRALATECGKTVHETSPRPGARLGGD